MITIDGERKREHSSQDKHNGGSSTGEKGGAFRSQSTGLPNTHRLRLWSGEEEGEKRTPAYRQAFWWGQASVKIGRLTSSWQIVPGPFQLSNNLNQISESTRINHPSWLNKIPPLQFSKLFFSWVEPISNKSMMTRNSPTYQDQIWYPDTQKKPC